MVFVVRAVMVLLLGQVFVGDCTGLIPEVGRRKYSESGRQNPPLDVLNTFELRLLNMFGLKRRPNPSKLAIIPQYMMDLYNMHSATSEKNIGRHKGSLARNSEKPASRANTIRSFHHDGKEIKTIKFLSFSLPLTHTHSHTYTSSRLFLLAHSLPPALCLHEFVRL